LSLDVTPLEFSLALSVEYGVMSTGEFSVCFNDIQKCNLVVF